MMMWQVGEGSPAEISTKRRLRGDYAEWFRIMQLSGYSTEDLRTRGLQGRLDGILPSSHSWAAAT